ncbi:MAG: hypothetical protein R3B90_12755, partial [Planctomycetaceae bacterium]
MTESLDGGNFNDPQQVGQLIDGLEQDVADYIGKLREIKAIAGAAGNANLLAKVELNLQAALNAQAQLANLDQVKATAQVISGILEVLLAVADDEDEEEESDPDGHPTGANQPEPLEVPSTVAPTSSNPLSPSNYPNPDPPMSVPPVRYDPQSIDEVIRM